MPSTAGGILLFVFQVVVMALAFVGVVALLGMKYGVLVIVGG